MYRIIYEDGKYYTQYRYLFFWVYFKKEAWLWDHGYASEIIKFDTAKQARKYIRNYIEKEKSEECKSPRDMEIIEVIKN